MIHAAPAVPDRLPDRLTDAQRRAVTPTGGPLLVVAGPGAGKTSVMVRRAASLVLEHGVDPGSLLVTTFTNEAAEKLFDRLHRFLGARTNDVDISTLQCVAWGILWERQQPEDHTGEGSGAGAGESIGADDIDGRPLAASGRPYVVPRSVSRSSSSTTFS